jgi:hypothetical protein
MTTHKKDTEIVMDVNTGDPMDQFSQMTVYVHFDSDSRSRRPVENAVAGHPGQWICAYSSLARLIDANHGEEVEYSSLRGEQVLAYLPEHAGVWLDRTYPNGRKIVLPQHVDPSG